MRNILIADKYRDKVSFVIRHFPIVDPQESSRYTALAVECANEQGFFTEMFYKIFGGSVQADKIDLRKYAAEIGADNMQFSACLETEKYFANVNQDFIDAVKLRLNGTPAMFLGGELFEGYLGQNEIEKILDILLIQQ